MNVEAKMHTNESDADGQVCAKPGKYLTFELADEAYGIDVLKVHEIIQMTDVTRLPTTPDFIRGVINLRGKILHKEQKGHCI